MEVAGGGWVGVERQGGLTRRVMQEEKVRSM